MHEQIALPACAHRGEHTATPGIGGCGIGSHTTHNFIVFVEPDQVARIERAAVGDEQSADVSGLRGIDGISCGIDKAVRIGAVCQQQFDELAIARPRCRMQGCAARRIIGIRPRRIGTRSSNKRATASWAN
jgi:hypothetical protein